MTLESLFQKRQSVHQKQLFKYLKVVLNDHFVVALLIVIGAMGFVYSEYVDTVTEGAIFPRLILTLFLFFVLLIGKIGTLLQSADLVFLLPKENEFLPIMKKLIFKSLLLQLVPLALVSAAALPLLQQTSGMQWMEWPLLFLTLLGWKGFLLVIQAFLFQESQPKKRVTIQLVSYSFVFLGLLVGLLTDSITGVFAAIPPAIWSYMTLHGPEMKKRKWQWEYMVEREEIRLQRIYRFFNLFTDVAFVDTHTKRLRIIDPWINVLSDQFRQTHFYYLIRVFHRNTTYSGLVLRLMIIGSGLLYFTSHLILGVIISVLFVYLIGFQLLPLVEHVKHHVFFRLYPIESTGKIEAIKRLILFATLVPSIVFSLVGLHLGWMNAGIVFIVNGSFSLAFSLFYVPKRLNHSQQ